MAEQEAISVFDIFKIGIGPSSSHTLGPWRACRLFLDKIRSESNLDEVKSIRADLFGSLAKTGKGHGTDIAIQMGLQDFDPETFASETLDQRVADILATQILPLAGCHQVPFDPESDITFHKDQILPFHPNGMTLTAQLKSGEINETYFSIGGGFVLTEDEKPGAKRTVHLPYQADKAEDLTRFASETGKSAKELILENERVWRTDDAINGRLNQLWDTMLSCIYRGCTTPGVLPGGLNVTRRAYAMAQSLLPGDFANVHEWSNAIKEARYDFHKTLRWVSCFAIAVNEENAAFGRVVTAPTNGAAGVIPAIMMYAKVFLDASDEQLRDFLLISGQIGIFFKKGATISAAMGGCMAEIGVSSAMAASGLARLRGASLDRVLMAAEISMEHHLGMTCDPIAGLVQIPCIERNTMGAVKAITAAELSLNSDPDKAKVSLDGVIKTMWDTAVDMNAKYKETSEGGLAVNIPVIVPEC